MRLPALFMTALTLAAAHVASAQAAVTPCTRPSSKPVNIPYDGQLTDIAIDDQCRFLYATDTAHNRVLVYGLHAGQWATPIAVGPGPTGLDFSPDGATLYVVTSGDTALSVIDLLSKREVRRIQDNQPSRFARAPANVAVAASGLVLYGRGDRMMQYDPKTGIVAPRSDFYRGNIYMRASGDRSIIGVSVPEYSSGPYYRYSSVFDGFSYEHQSASGGQRIALDATGKTALLGSSVLNEKFELAGRISSEPGHWGFAVAPDGKLGYGATSEGIEVFDMGAFRTIGLLPIGDTRGRGAETLAISRDGALIAAITPTGIALVRGGLEGPPLHATVYSAVDGATSRSILRFYNAGTEPGTVRIELSDDTNSDPLVDWESLPIPPGTMASYDIRFIEAGANEEFTPKARYLARIRSRMPGTFSHALVENNAVLNFSTCDSAVASSPKLLAGVHSRRVVGNPSYVSVVHTGAAPEILTLGVYNALTGAKLGETPVDRYQPGTGAMISMAQIEKWLRLSPGPGLDYYLVKAEGEFDGYLQHLVDNQTASAWSDLTAACVLPQAVD